MDNPNYQAPAFPPQIAQDNLGRVIAPIAGMSKLEYFSLQLLPTFLELAKNTKLASNGKPVTAPQAAIEAAKQLLDELTKLRQNENSNLSVIE
jgi:hypothetical protein